MVECEKCHDWFHFRCLGIVTDKEVLAFDNKPFYCGQKGCGVDKEKIARKKRELKEAKKAKARVNAVRCLYTSYDRYYDEKMHSGRAAKEIEAVLSQRGATATIRNTRSGRLS